jgi:hypothetical protein
MAIDGFEAVVEIKRRRKENREIASLRQTFSRDNHALEQQKLTMNQALHQELFGIGVTDISRFLANASSPSTSPLRKSLDKIHGEANREEDLAQVDEASDEETLASQVENSNPIESPSISHRMSETYDDWQN